LLPDPVWDRGVRKDGYRQQQVPVPMLTCAGGRMKGRRERTSVPPHCFIIERVKRAEGRVWHLLPDPVWVGGACKDGTGSSKCHSPCDYGRAVG
jgi:hypothetical protein